MSIENNLNADILKITMEIRTKYPELSKFINEMADTLPNVSNPEMNCKVLLDYYNSLDTMLEEYKNNSLMHGNHNAGKIQNDTVLDYFLP